MTITSDGSSVSKNNTTDNSLDRTKMLRAALAYAQRLNWKVFPVHYIENGRCSCGKSKCTNPGKHPQWAAGLIEDGVKSATSEEKKIRQFWGKWPKASIGIATGSASGIWVLDVDLKDNGPDSLEELINSYGELPETVEAITGGGGTHYFFKHVPGIQNQTSQIGKGLDVRGEGGYVLGSPSGHISGKNYEWELSGHPLEKSVQEAPEWLIALIRTNSGSKPTAKPVSHWTTILQGVGNGQRNHSAASLTGYLLRKGLDPEIAFLLINGWNRGMNNPPMDDAELARTFISILNKEIKRSEVIRIEYD
ncbi:bifunctional DNA primase/polymerase [Planococcus beigongshangi]|uniref:bifunctional DNA primase/polymerase n=1 Tax=Planococcus beigongshangi TaxID=2782536 RepID=UPI00193BF271|nr:bifunctional DNA primase/polymerase [Planococcus beigongshangi]